MPGQATHRFWVPGRSERPCPHHPWAPSHPGLSPSGPQTTGLSRGCRMGASCALLPRNTQGNLKQADWLPRWHISQREAKRGTGMPGWGTSPGLGHPCRVRGVPGWVPLGKPHELDWSPRVLGAARPRWGCHPGAAQVLVPQHTPQGRFPEPDSRDWEVAMPGPVAAQPLCPLSPIPTWSPVPQLPSEPPGAPSPQRGWGCWELHRAHQAVGRFRECKTSRSPANLAQGNCPNCQRCAVSAQRVALPGASGAGHAAAPSRGRLHGAANRWRSPPACTDS